MSDDASIPSLEDRKWWEEAFNHWWVTGDKSQLLEGLQSGRQIPQNIGKWLAGIMTGEYTPPPKPGDKAWIPERNRMIRFRYAIHLKQARARKKSGELRLRGESPQDIAKQELAEMYEVSVSTIERELKKR